MLQSEANDQYKHGFIDESLKITDIIDDIELQLISWDINERAPRFYTKWAHDNIGEE